MPFNQLKRRIGASGFTFIEILGGDGEDGVLDVFVLVHLGLVERFIEERWVVVLVGDADSDEFRHCETPKTTRNESINLIK